MFDMFKPLNSYRLTVFLNVHPKKLQEYLRGMNFVHQGDSLLWKVDHHEFRITPFKKYGDFQVEWAYRISFNGSIDGGMYLLDLSVGCFKPSIKAIEYTLFDESMKFEDWIREMRKRPSFLMKETKGLFQKGELNCVVIDHALILSLRKKTRKIHQVIECMKEIDKVRDDLMPNKIDLFSFMGNEVAV
ncbi:hypothetical protein ACFSCX_06485 [Bacillus salitolerans]|uniref:Uncharacterized protein n=1 Tax=Bacillus salitolerans TaxID=1437434 RepID=A0ABW4LQ30_9BACI